MRKEVNTNRNGGFFLFLFPIMYLNLLGYIEWFFSFSSPTAFLQWLLLLLLLLGFFLGSKSGEMRVGKTEITISRVLGQNVVVLFIYGQNNVVPGIRSLLKIKIYCNVKVLLGEGLATWEKARAFSSLLCLLEVASPRLYRGSGDAHPAAPSLNTLFKTISTTISLYIQTFNGYRLTY